MQRLDHHLLWRQVRGAIAEAPVPIRMALLAESSLERRTALDRLAAFIAIRIDGVDDAEEGEPMPLLFPELTDGGEPLRKEEEPVTNVIEKAPSFGRWLLDQQHRDDAIGELAKQAARDAGFPRDGDAKAVSNRLNTLGADGDAHLALEEAELDWLSL